MSLSFREQAAIAGLYILEVSTGDMRSHKNIIKDAQFLADECCKVWGHDYVTYRGADGMRVSNECQRCGAKK